MGCRESRVVEPAYKSPGGGSVGSVGDSLAHDITGASR
jgi:hypothetical protein